LFRKLCIYYNADVGEVVCAEKRFSGEGEANRRERIKYAVREAVEDFPHQKYSFLCELKTQKYTKKILLSFF